MFSRLRILGLGMWSNTDHSSIWTRTRTRTRVTFICENSVRSYSPQRPQIPSTSMSLELSLGNLHNHVKIFKFERGMLISRIFSRLHTLLFDLKLLEWPHHRSAYVKDRHCAEWDGSSSHRFLLYDHELQSVELYGFNSRDMPNMDPRKLLEFSDVSKQNFGASN